MKVYRAIEAKILSGDLDQGDALPTEAALCAQFGVTRSTVREGVRLLEQADLLARGAAKRFYVKRPSADDIALTASKGLVLSGASFRNAWEALATFYPPTAELAARRFRKRDLNLMAEVQRSLASSDRLSNEQIVDHAVTFFQLLTEGLQNRVLAALLESLNQLIGTSLRKVIRKTPNARQRIARAQAMILEAIEEKDGIAASQWMAKHIDDLRRGYGVAGINLDDPIA